MSECPRQFGAAARGFQFAPDIEMIVDFAVERHRKTAAVAVHGLTACLRQIENRKPAMAESQAGGSTGPIASRIRTAIGHRFGHGSCDGRELAFVAPTRPEQTGNAAHQPAVPAVWQEDPTKLSCSRCHCF